MRHATWLCVLVLSACPPAIRRPESTQLVVTGTLTAGGFSSRGDPLPGAQVSLRRAADGVELASNVASSAGGYRLTTTVPSGTRVIFVAEQPGYAPIARALTVGPSTELVVSAALTPLDPLECVDASCTSPLAEFVWSSPPSGASGAVATFPHEPPLRVDVDDTRPAILALAWPHLEGPPSGTLRLRVPRTRWPELVDALPGNATLEVPAASFELRTGQWARLPPVRLSSEGGTPLGEEDLAALRSGDFSGGAVAELSARSDVFVAVLGAPVPSGCATGTVSAEGAPAAGATLSFYGHEPVSTAGDGTFCARAPVSTQRARLGVQYAGLPYALEISAGASRAGTCGGTCSALGPLTFTADALRVATLCTVSGTVVDAASRPVASAEVVALDETVTGNATTAFCGPTGAKCALTAATAADGTFTLRAPVLNALLVAARSAGGAMQTSGAASFDGCPTAPVVLPLTRGVEQLEVSASFTGTQLSWSPGQPAARLAVLDGAGTVKWELASAGGVSSPVTFGVLPAKATETVAPLGAPMPGDLLIVELRGVKPDGVVFVGTGTAVRP
ncbi:MAG: carboxypeptidase-like regulatory domain-containing protein [Myxococcota bacterium]